MQEAWARLGNYAAKHAVEHYGTVGASVGRFWCANGTDSQDRQHCQIAVSTERNDQVNLLLDQLTRIEAISPGTLLLSLGEAFRFSGQGAADAGLKIEEYVALMGVGAGSGRAPGEFSRGLTQAFTRISRALAGHGRSSGLITESFKLIGFDLA